MFNFRYNVLALYNVILGLLGSVLLIKVFGVSAKADAYLIASNIVASVQMIQIMFVDQFMFFYNDLRVECREETIAFYRSAATFSLISGISFSILCFLAVHPLVRLFAFAIDGERYQLLRTILPIMLIGAAVESANAVNQRLLNAEMRFSAPYILASCQILFSVLVLAYLAFTGADSIVPVVWARSAGSLFACVAGFLMLARLGFPFRFSLGHRLLLPFVRNSLAMKFGHNIHNFLINPITNNVLAILPQGYASCFYYVQRFHQAVGNIVTGPSYAVYHSRVSRHWSEQNLAAIRADIRKFLPSTTAFFLLAVTMTYFLIPPALQMIKSSALQAGDVQLIRFMFLAMLPWYLIALVESPFLSVTIASKKSRILVVSNSMFIAAYFTMVVAFEKRTGIYSIPIAMSLAQLINLTMFVRFARKQLWSSDHADGWSDSERQLRKCRRQGGKTA